MLSYSSRFNQSLHSACPLMEKKINKLVHVLLQTNYDYTAVIANLSKVDVAEDGVRKYFKRRIEETQSDLQTVINIQQEIGGRVKFPVLRIPTRVQFDSVLEIMVDALEKEKMINKTLVKLYSRLMKEVEQPGTPEDSSERVERIVQERDQHIQQIVEHILHLQQNPGPVGEFTVSKLLKEEHFHIRKFTVENDQIKYEQSSKGQQSQMITGSSSSSSSSRKRWSATRRGVTKRPWDNKHGLISSRYLQHEQHSKRLHQQATNVKTLLTQDQPKSRFSKQFKNKSGGQQLLTQSLIQ